VSYDQPDFQDCNAVCSTKEKAIASVAADFDRCSDKWTNIVKEYETYSYPLDKIICQFALAFLLIEVGILCVTPESMFLLIK
jgi:hypothetical protein